MKLSLGLGFVFALLVFSSGAYAVTFGPSWGGEASLQTILDANGYSINTVADQTGIQTWTVPPSTDSMTFNGKFIGNYSSGSEAFGYIVNGDMSTYTPVFKTAGVNTDIAPELNPGDTFSFTVDTTNVTSIAFVDHMMYQSTNFAFATQNSVNGGEQHAVVYAPDAFTNVIGFEDLPLSNTDSDYQDLIVEISQEPSHDVPEFGTVAAGLVVMGSLIGVVAFRKRA